MSERILIIDDDDLVLSCFGKVLAKRFNVETALGSQRGIEAITTRGPYAVVLSDLQMPGLSGVALLTRARELSPQTVGVILTGNSDADGLQEALQKGIVSKLLQKPCSSNVLVASLEDAVRLHRTLSGNSDD